MRKGLIALAVLAFAIVGATSAFSQSTGEEHGSQAIDQIMGQIRSELKLGASDRIDPNQVPKPLMISLGDAVMDVMIPNQQQHEFMDQMMGGEGSVSLDSMHEWIAYRYLTSGYTPNGSGYGIMGYGMLQGGMMSGGMMGFGNGGWGMMGNPNVPYAQSPWQSPEQIAKQRYAQGQITRDQYREIMKDLQQTGANGKN